MQIKEQRNLSHISIHKILPYATEKQKKLVKKKEREIKETACLKSKKHMTKGTL